MLNTEIWKSIDNLPYEISPEGLVRRRAGEKYVHKGKTHVVPYKSNKGYLIVNLYKEGKAHKFLVHRLVATYYIDNPNQLPCINHKDGNPLNNAIGNLEWCTHQYNMQHAWDTGLHGNRRACASVVRKNSTSPYKGVSWVTDRNKWLAMVTVDKKKYHIGRFISEIEAAKAYDNFLIQNNFLEKGYKLNFS